MLGMHFQVHRGQMSQICDISHLRVKLRIYICNIYLIHQVNVIQPYTITNNYIANLSYCPVLYDEEPLQPS